MNLASPSLIVAVSAIAALLALAAALAAPDGERRWWLGVAGVMALFGAHKYFALQNMVVARAEAMIHAGGWYAERRLPQAIVVALLVLAAGIGAWRLGRQTRQRSITACLALAAAVALVLYAVLGLVSLHQWDGFISRPLGPVPLYAIVEFVLPSVAGVCALAAIASPRAGPAGQARPRQALVAAYLLGWMLLPVAAFAPMSGDILTPGTALPGWTLVSKTAALPLVLVAVSLIVAWPLWRRWRPDWIDLVMVLFCASPLLHGRGLDAAYLASAWLATWLLGRVLLTGADARRDVLALIAFVGLALVPVALLEGVTEAWLYTAVYGPHPFQTTGVARYIGFRPVGFFEDGNQYGIWTAMAALAAIELARRNRSWRWIAAILILIALAAQSAGALLLLLVGAVAVVKRLSVPRWLLPAAGGVVLAGAAVYLSGVVPMDHLARHTRPGQLVLQAFRGAGRGSLPWRISQDQRALPLIAQHPVIGYGTWDWWRPLGRRPWGLPMLVIGQYGIVGVMLLAVALLAGALAVLWRGVRDERYALAVMVVLASIDATLNSTVYFPAVLVAGALASMATSGRKAWA